MNKAASKQLPLLEEKRTDLFKLDPRSINVVEGFNVRQDYGNMDALVESIRENGVRVPVKGYKKDGEFFLTDGHRRLQAAILLVGEGVEIRIPFVTEKSPSETDRLLDMFLCNDGKSLNAIEQADLVSRLSKLGLENKEIAQKIGVSVVTINNMMTTSKLPASLKKKIAAKEITATLVLNMIRSKKDLTVDNIEQHIDNILHPEAEKVTYIGETNDVAPSAPTKITAKTLKQATNTENSIGHFKKLIRKMEDLDNGLVITENKEMFDFVYEMVNGKYNYDQLLAKFGIE